MKKKLIGVLAALMSAVLLMSGCATLLLGQDNTAAATPLPTATQDPSTVIVAEVNGVPIYKDAYISMYIKFYSSYYGYYSEAQISSFALDQLIIDEVTRQKFAEKGYDVLTEEERAQAEKDMMDDLVAYMEENCLDKVTANLGEDYTDEELRAAEEAYADTLLAEYNLTREEFLQSFITSIVYQKAYEAEVGSIAPTEQEIKDTYDEKVAADKETIMENPTSYTTSVNSGTTVYYIPAGVRLVRQVLIPMDEEMAKAISLLRSSGYDTAADLLQAEALSAIEEEANAALGKLEEGVTFDELITEYDSEADLEKSYAVMRDATDHSKAYITAAFELAEPGDHSGIVATDDGYYILEYDREETAGPISYDKVKDTISEEISTTMQDEAWNELVDQWKSEASIQTYEGNL